MKRTKIKTTKKHIQNLSIYDFQGSLDGVIEMLQEMKLEAEKAGYKNLEIDVKSGSWNSGYEYEIDLYGEREVK